MQIWSTRAKWCFGVLNHKKRKVFLVERTIATDERLPLCVFKERATQQVTVGKGIDSDIEEGRGLRYSALPQVY